jgi:hypothetical protein
MQEEAYYHFHPSIPSFNSHDADQGKRNNEDIKSELQTKHKQKKNKKNKKRRERQPSSHLI